MNEESSSTSSAADFLTKAEQLLTPVYAECFTEETRKVRNLLLLTSSVLILFVFGVVTVGDAVDPLPLAITVKAGMRWILTALCAYFLLVLIARSYIDWKLWRLRQQAPMTALGDLSSTILNSWLDRTKQADAKLASSVDSFFRLTEELKAEPMAVSPLQPQRDELSRQFENSRAELARERDLPEAREFGSSYYKLLNRHYELFEELDDLDRQLREERVNHDKGSGDKREMLSRQLARAREDHRNETTAPDLTRLEAQIDYLHAAARPIRKVLIVRLWLEMLFPLSFGFLALILGFVVQLTV